MSETDPHISVSDPGRRRETTVSVVVPTYNERENVRRVVDRCISALEGYDFEVVVVDDDSPDGTWRLARRAYGDDDRVSVVRRVDESGLATAVSRGFREATNDVCVVIDADLQHPPERIPDLLDAFDDEVDLVVGSRNVEGGEIEGWSRFRKLVSTVATCTTWASVPGARRLDDPMSGFFAVRRECVEGVELDPLGYKILLEVLVRADVREVVEVPYTFRERERGESKLTAAQYVRFLEHTLELAVESRSLDRVVDPKRSVRFAEFCAVGGVGVLVNLAVFAVAMTVAGNYPVAGTVAFLAAANANFVGNWVLTFDQPEGSIVGQYLEFHAVAAVGFLIYMGTLIGLVELLVLLPLLANLLAIASSSVWNYLGSERIAFGVQ